MPPLRYKKQLFEVYIVFYNPFSFLKWGLMVERRINIKQGIHSLGIPPLSCIHSSRHNCFYLFEHSSPNNQPWDPPLNVSSSKFQKWHYLVHVVDVTIKKMVSYFHYVTGNKAGMMNQQLCFLTFHPIRHVLTQFYLFIACSVTLLPHPRLIKKIVLVFTSNLSNQ